MSRGGLAALALLMGMAAVAPTAAAEPGPALSEPVAKLDGALICSPGVSASQVDPVLLVPAFSTADESYGWNYLPDLPQRGIPTCSVTLEDHGFDDLQRAAEYAVHAIRSISARSGREGGRAGPPAGAFDLLWALRWRPTWQPGCPTTSRWPLRTGAPRVPGSICSSAASCPPSAWQSRWGRASWRRSRASARRPGRRTRRSPRPTTCSSPRPRKQARWRARATSSSKTSARGARWITSGSLATRSPTTWCSTRSPTPGPLSPPAWRIRAAAPPCSGPSHRRPAPASSRTSGPSRPATALVPGLHSAATPPVAVRKPARRLSVRACGPCGCDHVESGWRAAGAASGDVGAPAPASPSGRAERAESRRRGEGRN